MKYMIHEPHVVNVFAKKRLFDTKEEALAHIAKCMVNDKVVAWVRENAGEVDHQHLWEIVECIQKGDHEYEGRECDDCEGEIEGEKIAFFGLSEMFATKTFCYSDCVRVFMYDLYYDKVIAERIIRN